MTTPFVLAASPAGIDLTELGSTRDVLVGTSGPTTPKYKPGSIVSTDQGEYRYCKAAAIFAAGDLCFISDDNVFTATGATTTNTGIGTNEKVGFVVPQVAVTSGAFFWGFVGKGQFQLSVATSIATQVKLTTTAGAKVAGTGGNAIGASTVGNTSGGAAVVTCYAAGDLNYAP